MGGGLGRGGGEEREFGLAGKLADGALSLDFGVSESASISPQHTAGCSLHRMPGLGISASPVSPTSCKHRGRIVELDAADR